MMKFIPISAILCLLGIEVCSAFPTRATFAEQVEQVSSLVGNVRQHLDVKWSGKGLNFDSKGPRIGNGVDFVPYLPGVGKTTSDIFSGYVTVDESAGRALFYTYVESSGNPDEDPLVLWLNGGPGCSSLAGGFLSELGPYYPTAKGTYLQENKHSWTKVANIVFLESPAFVGWSYSNTSEDRIVGDARTASDSLAFLTGFLDRQSHLKGRPFYLAGESYGGHYVPNLALAITKFNKDQIDEERKINLQGFLVGNAWSDPSIDNEGAIDFWYSHAIISQDTSDSLKDSCNFSHIGPLTTEDEFLTDSKAQKCRETIESSAEDFLGINIYDVYADICLPKAHAVTSQLAKAAGPLPISVGAYMHQVATEKQRLLNSQGNEVVPYDPCVDDEVTSYFNRADVQQALHANISGSLPGPWQGCSDYVQYSRKDLFSSMLPVYKELLEEKLRILIFSGDVDGIVPVTGSRRWIHKLGLDIEKPWRTWHSSTGQVGGHVVEHGERFFFATVRNAGHMVPYTQGERSFYLFKHYLSNQELN